MAGAAASLAELWTAPSQAWARDLQAWWSEAVARTWSPYQLNPLNLNPLRDLLTRTIDFDGVRRCDKLQLFISATHVRSGRCASSASTS
jgi:NTE family protein